MPDFISAEKSTVANGNYPPWAEEKVTLFTKLGDELVTGLTNPLCPGLAVTMHAFGRFDVTHIQSGKVVSRGYERVASACLSLVELSLCADWTKPSEGIAAWLKEHGEEPAGIPDATVLHLGIKRPMNKSEVVQMNATHYFFDEFPWEGGDGPSGRVHDLLTRIAQKKAA